MASKITPEIRDYINPVIVSVRMGLNELNARVGRREIDEWTENDYALAAATAERLVADLYWVSTALEVIRDIKAGAIDDAG